MFSWLYLTQKKHLAVDRDHAYAMYRLAELTRCMPGAIARVGPANEAMVRLLADAVGDGRDIVLVEQAGDTLRAETTPPTVSSLPGLPAREPFRSGIRRFPSLERAERELGAGQRFCFVHLLGSEPADLQRSLSFFLARLSSCGMLLLEIPADVPAEAFCGAVQTLIADRRAKVLPLQTRHCLIIDLPAVTPRRLDPQVRIRQQQPLAAAV